VTNIPPSHPRYKSLMLRERIVEGYKRRLVVLEGLIAHGRGEAFDYLLGEETRGFALKAARAGVAAMLLARHPVISVNGNTAALAAEHVVRLAEATGAYIEVNLFYRSREREEAIADELRQQGAHVILGVGDDASATIPELQSERRRVSPRGILVADVVLVPLEDGDRTEALRRMGKTVVAVDLNRLETQPVYDPVAQLIYAASRDQVTHTWVGGRCLMDNRTLTTLNEAVILKNAQQWQEKIAGADRD